MFITITSLFREVKLITTLIINITQHNTTKVVIRHLPLGQCYLRNIHFEKKNGCIPTPKTLKLYDYQCFYRLNDDFGEKFQNPFSPKLFTEIFGDLIKKPTEHLFTENIFTENFRS